MNINFSILSICNEERLDYLQIVRRMRYDWINLNNRERVATKSFDYFKMLIKCINFADENEHNVKNGLV